MDKKNLKTTNKKIAISMIALLAISASTQAQNSWNKSGNSISSGDFIGTTNNQALVLKVNRVEGMRLRADNTISFNSKVVCNSSIKIKNFKIAGPNVDRLISTDNVGNLQLATDPVLSSLTVTNNFTANGGVGIGTNTIPSGFKLAVNGKMIAEEVLIRPKADWPDYVFDEKYEMRTLFEVEAFINENNHLPNIPSEKEVAEEGVSLGEMDSKLLRKIEELTLYTIEQQKSIVELKEKVEELEKN